MSKVTDIESAKGKVTPRELLKKKLDEVENIEQITIITTDKNDVIRTKWNDGDLLEIIGGLELAKRNLIDANVFYTEG